MGIKSHQQWVILTQAIQLRGVNKNPGTRLLFTKEQARALVAQGKATFDVPAQPARATKVVKPESRAASKAADFMAKLRALKGTKGGFKKAKKMVAPLGVKASSWAELLSEAEAALQTQG